MEAKDVISICAIIISPVIAVIITLWHSSRKEKQSQKMSLFMTLIANRKTYPIPAVFVNALNTIDVVFHGEKTVIDAWKALFASYHVEPFQIEIADRKLLDLLDAMAKSLDYNDIKQTDFDSFYDPTLFANQRLFQETLNQEVLRVYRNSENLGTPRK